MYKMFTNTLLEETCPKNVRTRLSELRIKEALESRKAEATAKLLRILEDKQDFPAVYNYYLLTMYRNPEPSRGTMSLANQLRRQ